jgi:hypothetical protein
MADPFFGEDHMKRRASALLAMLLGMFAARGLAAEALDSWRAWVVFKEFVRLVDEYQTPGSVCR